MCLALFLGLSLTQISSAEKESKNKPSCSKYYYAKDVSALAKRAWSRVDGPKTKQRRAYRHRKHCHAPGKKNRIIFVWKRAKKKFHKFDLVGVSSAYEKFALLLHKKTGLSLRVIGAWELAEGGPSHNPLNIGPGHYFGTIENGAKQTSNLLHTSTYKNIMKATKKSDAKQISAIVASPWCPGCAGYSSLLWGTYSQVKVK